MIKDTERAFTFSPCGSSKIFMFLFLVSLSLSKCVCERESQTGFSLNFPPFLDVSLFLEGDISKLECRHSYIMITLNKEDFFLNMQQSLYLKSHYKVHLTHGPCMGMECMTCACICTHMYTQTHMCTESAQICLILSQRFIVQKGLEPLFSLNTSQWY